MSKKGKIIMKPSDASISSRYAIIYTQWNKDIVDILLENTEEALLERNVSANNIHKLEVPGAFELPLAAKKIAKGNFDAIIALGCIIRGETPHFDFIANSCASGLIKVSLEINKPVIFGVLTTNSYEQALERADPKKGNKGLEAALSAMLFIDNLSLTK